MTVIAPATITALSTRPSRASTVLFPDAETMASNGQKYTYGTRGTPTSEALCKAIDALEGSAGTVCVPSGLAAITVPLLGFLSPGDHALLVDSIYYPTRHFANTILKRMGVDVEYYDPEIGADIAKLMRPNTKVVFTESPASNTFEIQDIPAIAEAAHKGNAIVMMDNTWATPLYFRALDFGVDISIHAATKYPSGHSDILFGTISTNEKCWPQLLETHGTMGLCAGPDDTYQILRRLRTMGIRLEHHRKSALEIARWLENHQWWNAFCIQPSKAIPAMKSGNAIFPVRPAFSPLFWQRADMRKRAPSSTRWRFSASAIRGVAIKALRLK